MWQLETRERGPKTMLSYEYLQNQGLTIWIAGDKLRIAPREKVTPELMDFIRAHKQDIMAELQRVVYSNPYPTGTPEARRESLMQCMDAIYQTAMKQVRGELIPDQRIEAVRQAVLKGQAKLKDFRAAVNKVILN